MRRVGIQTAPTSMYIVNVRFSGGVLLDGTGTTSFLVAEG